MEQQIRGTSDSVLRRSVSLGLSTCRRVYKMLGTALISDTDGKCMCRRMVQGLWQLSGSIKKYSH
jgi:hypothetical protein